MVAVLTVGVVGGSRKWWLLSSITIVGNEWRLRLREGSIFRRCALAGGGSRDDSSPIRLAAQVSH